MQDWLTFYSLKNDPFVASPIVFGPDMNLFFKTRSIISSIDPFIQQLRRSPPSIRVLIGKRGMGKTTTLHYIDRKAKESGFMTLFIRFSDEPKLKITQENLLNQLVGEISRKLVKTIYDHKGGEIYKKYHKFFEKINDGLSLIEVENKLLEVGDVKKDVSTTYIHSIMEIIESEGIRILVLIDNLDKYDSEETISVLLKFLAFPSIQSLFETITEKGGVVILSLSQILYEKMREDIRGSYSYLSDEFFLKTLLPNEAKELLLQRFSAYSNSKFPIADNVIFEIVQETGGITRDILTSVKQLLSEAASEGDKTINHECYKRLVAKKDFHSLYQQLSQDYYFKSGSRSLFTIFNNLSNPANKKLIITSFSKILDNIDLNDDEADALGVEESIPVKKINGKYVFEDRSIKYVFERLKKSNINMVEYLLWYTKCSALTPEIIDIKESLNETRLRKIIDILSENDFSNFKKIRYEGPYSVKDYDKKQLKRYILHYANNSLSEIKKFEKTDLTDIPPNTVFEYINSCLWQVYNLYMLISSSRMGLDINGKFMNLFKERLQKFHKMNHIETKILEKIDMIYLERYPVLVEKTKELTHGDTQKYLRYMNAIIEELTRAILLSISPIGKYKEMVVNGSNSIADYLSNRINFSTTQFGILYLENIPKFEIMVLVIPYEYRWYCMIHGKSDFAKSLKDSLSRVSNAEFIFDNIVLGRSITDTNFLVSKIISKTYRFGFFKTAEINIPKVVLLETHLNKKKDMGKSISAEISSLKSISKEEGTFCVKLEKYTSDEITNIIPPDLPGKQRSVFVDNTLIDLARDTKSFFFTNDSDFDTSQLSGYEKLIYLSENDFDNIYLFDSLQDLFKKINSLAPGKTIRFIAPCHNIEYLLSASINVSGTDLSMEVKELQC